MPCIDPPVLHNLLWGKKKIVSTIHLAAKKTSCGKNNFSMQQTLRSFLDFTFQNISSNYCFAPMRRTNYAHQTKLLLSQLCSSSQQRAKSLQCRPGAVWQLWHVLEFQAPPTEVHGSPVSVSTPPWWYKGRQKAGISSNQYLQFTTENVGNIVVDHPLMQESTS